MPIDLTTIIDGKSPEEQISIITEYAMHELEIAKLKQQGDGNMYVFGSGNLSQSLMNAGLFDEYRLVIAPVILGKGRRLFTESLKYKKLQLLESHSLTNGGIILRYAPAEK